MGKTGGRLRNRGKVKSSVLDLLLLNSLLPIEFEMWRRKLSETEVQRKSLILGCKFEVKRV